MLQQAPSASAHAPCLAALPERLELFAGSRQGSSKPRWNSQYLFDLAATTRRSSFERPSSVIPVMHRSKIGWSSGPGADNTHDQGPHIRISSALVQLNPHQNHSALIKPSVRQQLHYTTLLKSSFSDVASVRSQLPAAHTDHRVRSSQLSSREFTDSAREEDGGARRDRTADLLRARQALSQLSYGPGVPVMKPPSKGRPSRDRCDWWVWVDLNHRPHPYQGCALTN